MVLASAAIAPGGAQDALKPSQTTVSSSNTVATIPAPTTAALPKDAGDKTRAATFYSSPWVDEVERLTQAGVDEGVVLSYVANSAGTFNLTADQIIHLKSVGASPEVINAMIQHDQELISGARPLTASYPPSLPAALQAALAAHPQPAAATAASPATPPAPAPAPSQVIANDDFNASGDMFFVEPDDVPEQPASAGPVRVPYAVKLNDPIVILKLPSFSVPCW